MRSTGRFILIIILASVIASPAGAQYEIYRANLHVHTLASYEPSSSEDHRLTDQPAETVQRALSVGLNVVGLSDHGGNIDSSEWSTLGNVADQYQGSQTTALRGFEWTWKPMSDSDHINVFGSDSYTDVRAVGTGTPPTTTGESLTELYSWLRSAGAAPGYGPTPVAQFDHIYYGTHLNNFSGWDSDLDSILCLAEIGCGESPGAYYLANPADSEPYFRTALQAGWHVAPSIGIDNQVDIQDQAVDRHTAILVTPGSGRAGVMDALRNKRVFASEDRDFELDFRCEVNDQSWYRMGDTVPAGGSDFKFWVIAHDPNDSLSMPEDYFASIDLMCSGQESPVHRWGSLDSTVFTGNWPMDYQQIRSLPITSQGETAFYLRIRQTGALGLGRDYIYSAPIWIHHYTPAPGTITTNITWKASGSPYVVNWLTIPAGTRLTIEPGTVVKFAGGAALNVQGQIVAEGTESSPIYFTSIKDDSIGGDTNGDGNATSPAAGNWAYVSVKGVGASGTFGHCVARYGGYYSCGYYCYSYGILDCRDGAVVSIADSSISHSSREGITCCVNPGTSEPAPSLQVTGSTVSSCGSTGISISSSLSPAISGCTVSGNSGGHGISSSSAGQVVRNCIIANNGSYGVYLTGESPQVLYCDLWGNSTNYYGSPDLTGTIFLDPLFVNSAAGDYHLQAASPCIDTGDPTMSDPDGTRSDMGALPYLNPIPLVTVAGSRAEADADAIRVQSAIVTAAFFGRFYIEADDRSSGMCVEMLGHTLSVGMQVDVSGIMRTSSWGERYIEAVTAVQWAPPGGTVDVDPLFLRAGNIGGRDWNYDPDTGCGQMGVKDGFGLNNIGLLVSTAGRVTYSPAGSYFVISDGSDMTDPSGYTGVRVLVVGLTKPEVGQRVKVTGISSIFKSGADYYPLIRVRTQSDILLLN